jgi:hypothetical protein
MINVKNFTQVNSFDDSIQIDMVEIDNGDGSFTSMTKDHYDKQQAEQSTPNLTDEPAAKS